jgi:hypothetical protein
LFKCAKDKTPPIHCGLLCRFIGARFVAATASTFVCQISASANVNAVTLHFRMSNGVVHLTVSVLNEDDCTLITKKSLKTDKLKWTRLRTNATVGLIYTSHVAQWACPIVAGATFMQIPHSGMRGCTILTSYTLAACAFAFAGFTTFTYDSTLHIAESSGVRIYFWPRHISVKIHTREYADIVPIIDGIAVSKDADAFVYLDSLARRYHVIDEFIVQTCRTVVLAQAKKT